MRCDEVQDLASAWLDKELPEPRASAVAEHEALMAEADASRYLRHTGWLKLYRSDRGFAGTARERAFATLRLLQ